MTTVAKTRRRGERAAEEATSEAAREPERKVSERVIVARMERGAGAGAAGGEMVVETKEEVVAEAAEASGIVDAETIRVVMSGGSRSAEASGITDAKTLLVIRSGSSEDAEVSGIAGAVTMHTCA